MTRAYLGLGANLGDAAATLTAAAAALERYGTLAAHSSLYRTAAWGVTAQPSFINAVVALDTSLDPYALLAALSALEIEFGRVATFRWGPRAIDLDILTYGDVRLDDPTLTIPHPRLEQRAFVLVPLAEVDARFTPLRDALPAAERDGVERIGFFEREGAAR